MYALYSIYHVISMKGAILYIYLYEDFTRFALMFKIVRGCTNKTSETRRVLVETQERFQTCMERSAQRGELREGKQPPCFSWKSLYI